MAYRPTIAYFSMEVGIEDSIPTFSGGLGVLGGDHLKTAADLGLPLVGVSLLYNCGYFRQSLDEKGRQIESYEHWDPSLKMHEMPNRVTVKIEDRDVVVKGWRYDIKGRKGIVPVYFLDTNGNGNKPWDERITMNLYGGNHPYYRLAQEAVLAGGVKFLEKLGYDVHTYHMNESHSALLTTELFRQLGDIEKVRERCVFTTHSPVAGHENFNYDLVRQVCGDMPPVYRFGGSNYLSMTQLALNTSRYVNAVSRKHARASRDLLGIDADYITNGVHSYTWTSPDFQDLFDAEIPEWRDNPAALEGAAKIEKPKILSAHMAAKKRGVEHIRENTGIRLVPERPIIGFARRIVDYKRPWLLFSDFERLADILKRHGGQVVYGGKAHPNYDEAKQTIEYINYCLAELRKRDINAVYVPNYGMNDCAVLTSASDIWLNNPRIPFEASGTSGMCAAHDGVPQLGTLDGWWCEGHIEEATGWSIGGSVSDDRADAEDLYQKLDRILPQINRGEMAGIMAGAIAKNASYFNTERMVKEYDERAYNPDPRKKEKRSA